jgi:hypothetical protein
MAHFFPACLPLNHASPTETAATTVPRTIKELLLSFVPFVDVDVLVECAGVEAAVSVVVAVVVLVVAAVMVGVMVVGEVAVVVVVVMAGAMF